MFELAIFDLSHDQGSLERELWQVADEQFLPAETRMRLATVGIRCGSLGAQLPDAVSRCLEAQQSSVVLEEKDGAAVISDLPTQRRFQCRPGRPQYILVRKTREESIRSLVSGDSSIGDGVQDVVCELCIKAHPLGDGRVHLAAAGVIRHGGPRQRWVAEQGQFRLDNDRECKSFDESRVEASLVPGQSVVWGAMPNAAGLGGILFGEDPAAGGKRRIVVLRLAHSQRDDLFTPQKMATPIVTSAP